ncbi:MAG: peroxide stress protein YaaA, partial [Dermabacter sp.]|nr:peroxide stress protein YaaA [Dermabacter sp.]
MLILLPPSETKTRPTALEAPSLDLASMSWGELREAREDMLRAAKLTAESDTAMSALKIPTTQPELRERMAHLESEPVAPPLEVYSGVLYDALGTVAVSDG